MQTQRSEIIEHEKILDHLQTFLLSLNQGFAPIGKNYPILTENQAWKIDLLLYHVKLRCYVVIECLPPNSDVLDIHPMNILLPYIDYLLRHPQDNISIGLIVYQTEGKVCAQYVFKNIFKSREINSTTASYQSHIVLSLPRALKEYLPSIKKIEKELSKNIAPPAEAATDKETR